MADADRPRCDVLQTLTCAALVSDANQVWTEFKGESLFHGFLGNLQVLFEELVRSTHACGAAVDFDLPELDSANLP